MRKSSKNILSSLGSVPDVTKNFVSGTAKSKSRINISKLATLSRLSTKNNNRFEMNTPAEEGLELESGDDGKSYKLTTDESMKVMEE